MQTLLSRSERRLCGLEPKLTPLKTSFLHEVGQAYQSLSAVVGLKTGREIDRRLSVFAGAKPSVLERSRLGEIRLQLLGSRRRILQELDQYPTLFLGQVF